MQNYMIKMKEAIRIHGVPDYYYSNHFINPYSLTTVFTIKDDQCNKRNHCISMHQFQRMREYILRYRIKRINIKFHCHIYEEQRLILNYINKERISHGYMSWYFNNRCRETILHITVLKMNDDQYQIIMSMILWKKRSVPYFKSFLCLREPINKCKENQQLIIDLYKYITIQTGRRPFIVQK